MEIRRSVPEEKWKSDFKVLPKPIYLSTKDRIGHEKMTVRIMHINIFFNCFYV